MSLPFRARRRLDDSRIRYARRRLALIGEVVELMIHRLTELRPELPPCSTLEIERFLESRLLRTRQCEKSFPKGSSGLPAAITPE